MESLATNLNAYLIFSSLLFVLGLVAALSRKSSIGVFMGVELMLNAAGINFVAFQVLRSNVVAGDWLHGHIFALFIIVLAAIEAAVALAIVLRIFGSFRSIDPDKTALLKG